MRVRNGNGFLDIEDLGSDLREPIARSETECLDGFFRFSLWPTGSPTYSFHLVIGPFKIPNCCCGVRKWNSRSSLENKSSRSDSKRDNMWWEQIICRGTK